MVQQLIMTYLILNEQVMCFAHVIPEVTAHIIQDMQSALESAEEFGSIL